MAEFVIFAAAAALSVALMAWEAIRYMLEDHDG